MSFKFQPFNRTDVVYKTISKAPLTATILVPKSAEKGKHPLLAHFHGRGLLVGDRMFGEWFPLWLLQFAVSREAIVVTPDYRLIPEANGTDILEDVKDFWDWVHSSVPSKVSETWPGISVNLSRIAAGRESAVMTQYGTLDISHFAYNPAPANPPSPEKARMMHPEVPIHVSLQPGSHGFDTMSTMDDAWVKEGVEFVKKYW
ncbi:MAG: hypothetical protein M1834_006508 [Cirrosporium novae-zelandiae]|nr:MAG: hypothetical protein M1834_006508 [Cirrosporium novae-zelandiae]